MSWKYREPLPGDYESEEDYEEALEEYQRAVDDYCSWVEEHRG